MYRRLNIENDITLSGYSGTHRVPLPRERAIGAIEIVVKGVNGATSNMSNAAEQNDVRKAIEGLKVKSGKRVFYDTNGIQNRDIMTYETGRLPWEIRTQVGGASYPQYALFTIPFWVEPMIPETGLPAPMLTSLDLEIEYNFAQSATIGFASTGHQVNIAAWLYDMDEANDVLAQKQFRVIEQKHDHTSLASGVSPFTLTEDIARNLRRLYIEAYKVSTAEGGVISDVQVKKGNDEIYGSKWTAIQAGNAENCKLNWLQSMTVKAGAANDVLYTRVPNLQHGNFMGSVAADRDDTEYVSTLVTGVYTFVITDAVVAYLNYTAQEIPTLAVIDWDLLKDLGNMVPQGPDKLVCNLTNAAASGEVKIVEESISRMWT